MFGMLLQGRRLDVLEKFFQRSPDTISHFAHHLNFTPIRSPDAAYVCQVLEKIQSYYDQGHQVMFLTESLQPLNGVSIPICGFIRSHDGCWNVRVSLLHFVDQDVESTRYFEEWLERLKMYARRQGRYAIHIASDTVLRPVLKFRGNDTEMPFDSRREVYVISL